MSTVTLREARFEEKDLQGIWELQRRLFVRNQSCLLTDFVLMLRHKWLDNPARTPDHVLGWVLESAKDGIVGFVGLVPIKMKVGSREIFGACGTTFVVSPAYRAYSVMLFKQFLGWGERQLLLDTASNKFGNKLNAFGMTRIPVANFDRYLLWPIRPEVAIKWRLDNSSWRNWSSLIARVPFTWLLKAGARVRFARNRRVRFPGATLPVEQVKEFTDEFTQFWEDHKTEYGVTTVRDRTYLQWRFLNAPAVSGITCVFACRDKGRLAGYLALMELNPQEGLCSPGRYRVIDVFYNRSRPDVVYSLMNHAFEFAKARGCSVFEVASVSRELADMLSAQQPYVRQTESWTHWYKVPTQELAEACRREVWWPSGSDGDANF